MAIRSMESDNTGGGGSHNHGFTGTASTQSHVQPYITCYMWKRVSQKSLISQHRRNQNGFLFGAHGKKVDVCPVANGGTGAKTKSIAQQNLGIESRQLLWTNPNPTSSFSSLTINLGNSINVQDFDALDIEYHLFTGSKLTKTVRFAVDDSDRTNMYTRLFENVSAGAVSSQWSMVNRLCEIGSANHYVIFANCYKYDVTKSGTETGANVTEDNTYIIPYKVYGIKYNL